MSIVLWLLGVLGLGGAGIGVAALLGGGPAMLLFGGKALTFAKAIPPKAWLIIGCVAALLVGVIYHQHKANAAISAAEKRGADAEDRRVVAAALKLKDQVDALTAKIAAVERKRNDEENRRIAAAADNLRLRGPGKAVCSGGAVISSAARGLGPPNRPGDAALARLPDHAGIDLIGLPFDDAVSFGEDHDLDRAEVTSWRTWYPKMVAAWKKLLGDAAVKPPPKP